MAIPMSAEAILDRYFLEMRHKVLDLGAALDRIERAGDGGQVRQDARMAQLQQAIGVLTDGRPDRATRVHMAFSDPYDENWARPTQEHS